MRGQRAVPAVARVFAAARGAPSSVGADSISARGVCGAAGCGGMRASRPTVVWVVAAVPVWPEAQNLFVGAGFIPPAGVCAGAGSGGMRASRPTNARVVAAIRFGPKHKIHS